jgi:hypothetical protein
MSSVHKYVIFDTQDAYEPSCSSGQFLPLQHAVTGDVPKPVDISGVCSTFSPKSECKFSPPQADSVDVEGTTKVQWSEMDFPPLTEAKGDRGVESSVCHEKKASRETEEFVPFFSEFGRFTNTFALSGNLSWQLLVLEVLNSRFNLTTFLMLQNVSKVVKVKRGWI